jgi:hypothetical protein
MDSRKCQTATVTPAKPGDYPFYLYALALLINPFALVVLAQLAAVATKRDPAARLDRKIGLTRRLYRFGLSRDEVLSLFAFIDWVMTLPEPLEDDYHRAIQAIEEAEQMRFQRPLAHQGQPRRQLRADKSTAEPGRESLGWRSRGLLGKRRRARRDRCRAARARDTHGAPRTIAFRDPDRGA